MDKALKIGRLIAYVAETVMATFVVADTIENLASKHRKAKEDNNGKPAESKAATQA